MPRLLSMLCILAVFVPSFFMVGVGRQLFVPLSLAVGFSMISSYLLSSTLVPVFSTWLMREGHEREAEQQPARRRTDDTSTGMLRLRWLVVGGYTSRSAARPLRPGAATSAPSCSPTSNATSSSCACARPPEPASRRPS